VLGESGAPAPFTALLAARGLSGAEVEPVEPTLEDVFLELVSRSAAGKAAPASPAPASGDRPAAAPAGTGAAP
jgi:hypothetical protein